MLAKLRATNIDQVRQVAHMPTKEADRCVKADNPRAAVDAWLARDAAETHDAAEDTSMPPEGVEDSAPAAPAVATASFNNLANIAAILLTWPCSSPASRFLTSLLVAPLIEPARSISRDFCVAIAAAHDHGRRGSFALGDREP